MQSLLKSRKFEVVRRSVKGDDGGERSVDVIVHPGAVVVLPLLSDDELIMLRNYRASVDRELWELPAGTLDIVGEDPKATASRELEEEAGHLADRLELLCEFYPSPGVMTELIRAYVATGLKKTAQRLEPGEQIVVEPMKVAAALAMVRDGRIMDAKTMITLLRWDMGRRES